MRRPVCRPGTTQIRPRRPFRRRGRFSLDPLPEDRHAELSPSRHFVRSLFSFPGLLPPSFVLSPPVVPYFPLPPSPSFLLPVTLSLPPYVILSEAKDLVSPAACQRNGEKILRRLRLLRMTGRRPGMLRGDGTKTRHVPSRGWVPARLRTAAQSLAYPRTGTRKPSHSRTAGRSPAYLQTEVQELSLLRAAVWAWICRPFPGGTICWAEPAPACRKKKVTGKSGFTEFRPPQPPGCNPQIISKVNPMWGGRKKQKFCHFRGHAPGK